MSDQKILHIALVTKNSEILLTDPLQEQAAYAIKDMCKEKGWGSVSLSIGSQVAQAELALPVDVQAGVALREMKKAISDRIFEKNPGLKERQKGHLWSHNSVLAHSADKLDEKILRAIQYAYPGKHPSIR